MTTKEYYEMKIEEAKKTSTRVELMNVADEIVTEIMTDENIDMFISTDKRWSGYGTWKVAVSANQYHWGDDIANAIEAITFTTHDEDKEYEAADIEDYIREAVEDMLYCTWDEE